MSLQLLEDKRVGALNDEQEQLSKSIKENADRLLGITGELLNMTQVEAGKLQMMPKITKPIELIEYAIKANQVQADKFGIQIEVEYPEEKMPKLFVDSEKIAWVLTNLLSNAVRYSKKTGVSLLVPSVRRSLLNCMCRISAKVSIPVIIRAFSTVISVCPAQRCKAVDWDFPFQKILWRHMGEH